MALLLSEASLIGSILKAFLYGFSLQMFILTKWIILQNRKTRRPNYWLIAAACTIQILALAEVVVDSIRLWRGLIDVGPHLPGGPDSYFLDVSLASNVLKGCLYGAQTLILDSAVIYRTFVVWGSIYPVILPALGWCGLLASVIASNVLLATKGVDSATESWITALYALTLATNLSASVLLAYRIWGVNREAAQYRSSNRLEPVIHAVIESGAIYSATVTVALVLFLADSVGVYIVLDMTSPIICIVFNMIIVRVAFAEDRLPGMTSGGEPHDTISDHSAHETRAEARARRRHVHIYRSDRHELKSLAVQITQHVETEVDGSSVGDADQKDGSRSGDEEEGSTKRSEISFV